MLYWWDKFFCLVQKICVHVFFLINLTVITKWYFLYWYPSPLTILWVFVVCVYSLFLLLTMADGTIQNNKKIPHKKNAKKYKKKHDNQTNCLEKCSVVVIFFFLLSASFFPSINNNGLFSYVSYSDWWWQCCRKFSCSLWWYINNFK